MATAYWKTALVGGTGSSLDGIAHGDMVANDFCFVNYLRNLLYYVCEDSGDSEDSPWVIEPDDAGAGTLRWHLYPAGYEKLGLWKRGRLLRAGNTTVYIHQGGYNLAGRGWVEWDTTLTYTVTTLSNGAFSYIYIDYSDIAESRILDANDFVDSLTAPTWSAAGGWYNGSDRCIGAVFADASNYVTPFTQAGDLVLWVDESPEAASVLTSFTSISLQVPNFVTSALVGTTVVDTGANTLFCRRYGSGASTGRELNVVDTGSTVCKNISRVEMAPGFNYIDLKLANAASSCLVDTHGYYLPEAM